MEILFPRKMALEASDAPRDVRALSVLISINHKAMIHFYSFFASVTITFIFFFRDLNIASNEVINMIEFHDKFSEEEQNEFLEQFAKPMQKELDVFSREEGAEAKLKRCSFCITMEIEISYEDHSEMVSIIID